MVAPVLSLTDRCCGKIPTAVDSESAKAFCISALVFDLLAFLGCIGVGIWMATTGAPLAQIGYGLLAVSALIAILYIAATVKWNIKIRQEENSAISNEA
jgi:hypothetical protein